MINRLFFDTFERNDFLTSLLSLIAGEVIVLTLKMNSVIDGVVFIIISLMFCLTCGVPALSVLIKNVLKVSKIKKENQANMNRCLNKIPILQSGYNRSLDNITLFKKDHPKSIWQSLEQSFIQLGVIQLIVNKVGHCEANFNRLTAVEIKKLLTQAEVDLNSAIEVFEKIDHQMEEVKRNQRLSNTFFLLLPTKINQISNDVGCLGVLGLTKALFAKATATFALAQEMVKPEQYKPNWFYIHGELEMASLLLQQVKDNIKKERRKS